MIATFVAFRDAYLELIDLRRTSAISTPAEPCVHPLALTWRAMHGTPEPGRSRGEPSETSRQMEAKRTLVKSPPELWAQLSDVATLARHLGEFGDIRITRTEPEAVVEWEGDRAAGRVLIEPSGWGTRVTLTAQPPPAAPPAAPAPPAAEPARRPRRWERLRWWRRRARAAPEPAREPPSEPEPQPEPASLDEEHAAAVLGAVLDALGAAHHRPFSR